MEAIATQVTDGSGQGGHEGSEKRVDLVCEGGGVRGIALVGALAVLEEHGYQTQNMAGTSAGAIVATLYAAGYTAAELREVIGGQDFARFLDAGWAEGIPLAGVPMGLITRLGIYQGEALYQRMRQLLAAKGIARFKDLRSPHADDPRYQDDPRYRYKVQVIASDVSARRLLILPYHAAVLGYDPDELEVALAVRMSASIPFFFEPVRVQRPRLPHEEHVIVDGGLLSAYPIWFFDEKGPPRWPTFGLRLVEGAAAPATNAGAQDALSRSPNAPPAVMNVLDVGTSRPTSQIRDLVSYAGALVDTMLEAHDRLAVEMGDVVRTIAIPTLGISATDFHLTRTQADALYESGRHAAERFLASWDFASYLATYRSGGSKQGDSGRR